jgi:hypothetical protein
MSENAVYAQREFKMVLKHFFMVLELLSIKLACIHKPLGPATIIGSPKEPKKA